MIADRDGGSRGLADPSVTGNAHGPVGPPSSPPRPPGWLHQMKHMPHGARASFALVSLWEDATFVGGRYDNWNCPMVRRP